jgi:hypothetical protein
MDSPEAIRVKEVIYVLTSTYDSLLPGVLQWETIQATRGFPLCVMLVSIVKFLFIDNVTGTVI